MTIRTVLKKILRQLPNLGCGAEEFRAHIERQWLAGMTWENHGRTGWHIDHIRPKALFNFGDRGQYLACCHFTNLRPRWGWDNCSKRQGPRALGRSAIGGKIVPHLV